METKIDIKKVIITILLVLLTAGSVGGGVWYVMDQNFQKERDANDKAIKDLQDRITASNKTSETKTTNVTTTATTDQTATDETAIRKVISDFETSYKDAYLGSGETREDLLAKMFGYFTDAVTDSEKDEKSRLMTGHGTNGTLGGPVLFSTGGTNRYTLSFTFDSVNKMNEKYTVKVREAKKVYYNGDGTFRDTSFSSNFDVVKNGDIWLIDKYYTDNSNEKYVGFQNY